MNKGVGSFFKFSKKELNGILVFFVLLSGILAGPYLYSFLYPPKVYDYSNFKKEVEEFKASAMLNKQEYSPRYVKRKQADFKRIKYFRFDPNSLSEKGWQELGLSVRQGKVITKYLSKGGRFYKKEDLKKIYSITADDYHRLEPYIYIPRDESNRNHRAPGAPVKKGVRLMPVNLNTADSTQLEGLYGIGPAFARRIIQYRIRLGGFYSKEQLREVYGLDSSRYDAIESQIIIEPMSIKQVNINTAGFEDLKGHPYLNYRQINAILQYRRQHGAYRSLEDLKKIAIMDDGILRKIGPYLKF